MNPSQDTVIAIDEKAASPTVEEQEEEEDNHPLQQNNSTNEALPPSYDFSVHDCPPPPNYLHSTRLMYQNEPFISGFDTMDWPDTTTEDQQNDYSSETWSEINKLPFRQRLFYYLQSWAMIIYDCRFIFFVLAVCFSLALMFVIFALILLPDHY